MSITPGQTLIRDVKCSNCGREIPVGRLFCPFCGHRFVRPQDVADPKEQPAQSEEAQRLQASLQAAQNENQNLRQQLRDQQSELNRAKNESDTHREALDSHRAILKTTQEKLAELEPQVSEWRQRWNLADQKVRAVERELAARAKDLESALSRTGGSAQWSRRIKVIGSMLTLLGGLGGFGAGWYTKRDPTGTPNQLPVVLAKSSQAQEEVKDLMPKLDLAADREKGLKSQLDSANQKIDQFATNSNARDEHERATESKLVLVKQDLQSVQAQLADAVAKQRSAEQTMQKLVEQLNTSNQRNQQLEAQVSSLRAQPNTRPPNPSNVPKQEIRKGGVLLWTGVLNGKRQIDIKDGHPNYGSVTGALPGTPCSVFISDPSHATLKTIPSQKNHWREVSFEVLGAQTPQSIQVQITWILSQPH